MLKIVIILDKTLPLGILANAAAALAFSVARKIENGLGWDVLDGDGSLHPGITSVPLPVLGAEADSVRALRERAAAEGVDFVDFTETARRSKNYDEYTRAIGGTPEKELRYLGLCLYGRPEKVKGLTGSLPLLK